MRYNPAYSSRQCRFHWCTFILRTLLRLESSPLGGLSSTPSSYRLFFFFLCESAQLVGNSRFCPRCSRKLFSCEGFLNGPASPLLFATMNADVFSELPCLAVVKRGPSCWYAKLFLILLFTPSGVPLQELEGVAVVVWAVFAAFNNESVVRW